jgi:SPP1 family predicted phage head-tail adaptor
MQPGEMDQRVRIERKADVADGMGGFTSGWTTVATVWAKVEPVSGRERDMAAQTEAPRNYRITIRRRADLLDSDRLVWSRRTLNIRFIADAGGRQAYLLLDAEMGVAT